TGIDRSFRSMGSRGAGGDVGAGAEAGIEQALFLQLLERFGVMRQPLGLVDQLPVPFEAEPEQILDDPVDMLGPGAAGIDTLDPHEEAPVPLAREIMGEQGRNSVAEMQPSSGTWREASDGLHLGPRPPAEGRRDRPG